MRLRNSRGRRPKGFQNGAKERCRTLVIPVSYCLPRSFPLFSLPVDFKEDNLLICSLQNLFEFVGVAANLLEINRTLKL